MGREIKCLADVDGWLGEGRLLLETDELVFRGARKLVLPLASITAVSDVNGWLVVDHADGRARFDLGKLTPSWVNAIRNPRTRIDKLGVKPESRVLVVNEMDADFTAELAARTTHIVAGDDVADIAFVRIDAPDDLTQLAALRNRIAQNGAIWIVHPKGDPSLGHEVLVGAAKAAGLIDNKSARFSDSHTALRFVIPRAART